jgi:hypothetical protein
MAVGEAGQDEPGYGYRRDYGPPQYRGDYSRTMGASSNIASKVQAKRTSVLCGKAN